MVTSRPGMPGLPSSEGALFGIPARTGCRPVSSPARDGEHTGAAA